MKTVSIELFPLHPDCSHAFHRALILANSATDAQFGADHRAGHLASFAAFALTVLSLSSPFTLAGKVNGFLGQRAHLLAHHAVLVQPPRQAAFPVDGCLTHHLNLLLRQG